MVQIILIFNQKWLGSRTHTLYFGSLVYIVILDHVDQELNIV